MIIHTHVCLRLCVCLKTKQNSSFYPNLLLLSGFGFINPELIRLARWCPRDSVIRQLHRVQLNLFDHQFRRAISNNWPAQLCQESNFLLVGWHGISVEIKCYKINTAPIIEETRLLVIHHTGWITKNGAWNCTRERRNYRNRPICFSPTTTLQTVHHPNLLPNNAVAQRPTHPSCYCYNYYYRTKFGKKSEREW